MPVIRIDSDIWSELQRRAVPLVDTPNTVLRRLLGLDSKKQVTLQTNAIEIQLNNLHTHCWTKGWTLIPVPKAARQSRFFPGYKVKFIMESDIGPLTVQRTSAPKGTPRGDPDAGAYITGGLRQWYEKHPQLKDGDRVRIECINPGRRYKLSII